MTNMSIKYSKKMYYLWSTRKLEQSQSFRTGYYKAGQTDRECCTWKLYKDGQTWCAVHIPQNSCLSASAMLGLAMSIESVLANNKFCKHPDENFIIWLDCIWASAVIEIYFWYLPIVQKHSSHVELAISPTVGKSGSLDLACFVQAPVEGEGVWTRAMFGTSSTKSDSSILIELRASRTFLAHFALNLKRSPIVLCL